MPNRGYQGATGYRYGFNGMEKDDEVKGVNGSQLDFGARIYDSRVARFLSIDPKFATYPYLSPYVHSANNPILFIDGNGEGPIVGLLRIVMSPTLAISRWFGITQTANINVSSALGLAALSGAGASASVGVAVDPRGNFALVAGTGVFGDLASGLGGVAYRGVKDGNFALGAEASAKFGISIANVNSVLDLGGQQTGSSGVPLDIKGGPLLAGGVELGDNSFGLSIGIGVGAAISVIGQDVSVLATNLNDLEKFEDAFNAASKLAKENRRDFTLTLMETSSGDISVNFKVKTNKKDKKGNYIVKRFEAAVIKYDEATNSVSTGTVNK